MTGGGRVDVQAGTARARGGVAALCWARERLAGGAVAGGLALGVAGVIANALGYAFTVVLARAFSPADYGALVALVGAGLIGTIPAAGLQYVAARRTVALGLGRGRNDGGTLRLAAGIGGALLLAGAAVAPAARSWLHLSGDGPVLALAAALVPLTLAGAFQGGLLGHRRFAALGSVYVVSALCRFVGGVLTALAGWGVAGALGTLAAAAVLSTAFAWVLTGPRSWRLGEPARGEAAGEPRSGHPAGNGAPSRRDPGLPGRARALAGDVARACSAVAGIVVLTNADVLLARHYLGAEASGAYGVASLFAKAVLWSSQFVAQAAYPALASPAGRRRLLVRMLAATGGIGLAAVAFTAAAGGPVIHLLTGKQTYGAAVGLAPAFALLGVAWSLAQALLLAAVAAGDHRPGRLLWGVIAAEAATVAAWLHGSAAQILTACLLGVGAFAAVVAVLEFRAPGRVSAPAATAGPPPPNQ